MGEGHRGGEPQADADSGRTTGLHPRLEDAALRAPDVACLPAVSSRPFVERDREAVAATEPASSRPRHKDDTRVFFAPFCTLFCTLWALARSGLLT